MARDTTHDLDVARRARRRLSSFLANAHIHGSAVVINGDAGLSLGILDGGMVLPDLAAVPQHVDGLTVRILSPKYQENLMADIVTESIAAKVYDPKDPMTAAQGLAAIIIEFTNQASADRPDPTDGGFYLPAGKVLAKLFLEIGPDPTKLAEALAGVGIDVASVLLQRTPSTAEPWKGP